jgi:hypothetical protein
MITEMFDNLKKDFLLIQFVHNVSLKLLTCDMAPESRNGKVTSHHFSEYEHVSNVPQRSDDSSKLSMYAVSSMHQHVSLCTTVPYSPRLSAFLSIWFGH